MLVRVVVKNIYSFGNEEVEFNMLPSPRYSRLSNHKYDLNNMKLLKMATIYGANGAGKSNLIKSINLLQEMVQNVEKPRAIRACKHRFNISEELNPIIGIEFINNEKTYVYAIEFNENHIVNEELYISGLGKKDDDIVFTRKLVDLNSTELQFDSTFEEDQEGKVLKQVILKNLLKPNKSLMKTLAELDNPLLSDTKSAYDWFDKRLQIITPDSKPQAIAHTLAIDDNFHKYAEELMCSFHIGIKGLRTEKTTIEEFFKGNSIDEMDELIDNLDSSPSKMMVLRSNRGEEILLFKDKDNKIYVEKLKILHERHDHNILEFDLEDESDGTIRLLDFIPAFRDVVYKSRVYIIDEIERSIHPLLIKKLVEKFSSDNATNGQMIFTTHESNLLDQSIFRQDEIWFVEKNSLGSSDIYSLSDFKEHNTKDIRKGYLSGRYGSIPFLANLDDLSWHKYDTEK